MQTLNKGEWAEFYAFIKLLADGRVYYGDEGLNIVENKYFDIDKILKTRGKLDQIFYITDKNIKFENSEISRDDLKNSANKIFREILLGAKTFSIEEAEKLKTLFNLERFSEPSSVKSDIRLSLIDSISKDSDIYGFSIKTKLKAKSTLINSSGNSTGFRYKIEGFSQSLMKDINKIEGRSKVNDRIAKILDSGCKIFFSETTSQKYQTNLKMVDTSLDLIIGEMLLSSYIENKKVLKEAIKTSIFTKFFQSLKLSEQSIIYKIKNFLYISATGMTPSKIWDGENEVDGGIIVVKASGDLVGYFIFSLNKFKEYLWQNTYFETPSTTRHDFGYVYKENGDYYFDLNLQVRFR